MSPDAPIFSTPDWLIWACCIGVILLYVAMAALCTWQQAKIHQQCIRIKGLEVATINGAIQANRDKAEIGWLKEALDADAKVANEVADKLRAERDGYKESLDRLAWPKTDAS